MVAQVAADRTHRPVQEEPHIAHGELGDRADFLVAQATLELEVDDFALVARQRLENLEDPTKCLTRVVLVVEVVDDGSVGVLEGCCPCRFLARIERKVAAHGEQPRREMPFDSPALFPAQPEECFLDNVPRRFQIAEQPFRIADQRPFIAVERIDHPFGVRRPAHSSLW